MSLEQKTYITGIIDGNGKYSYELLKAKKEFYQRFIKLTNKK